MTRTRTDRTAATSPSSLQPFWRALAVFRVVALAYAGVLIAGRYGRYAHPAAGWAVLGAMALWSAVSVWAYAGPRRRPPWLAADLAVTALCLVSTGWVETRDRLAQGDANLTVSWAAAPVLAWAVAGGKRWGVAAALLMTVPDVAVRWHASGGLSAKTLDSSVLLLMAGLVVGHVARLAVTAEARLTRAVELEAATRERERLAGDIHDSVLQVLTLVQRRGGRLGGEAAELGRLAGEQEAALRALVASGPAPPPRGPADLRPLLNAYSSATVTVAAPATAVPLPGVSAEALRAAVGAALDNVRAHCGEDARAWVLVEESGGAVTVSVRDEGPGMPAGRLAEAAAAGRLGVARSIRGRVEDLGGTVTIFSAPGQGTEIEMTFPALRAA